MMKSLILGVIALGLLAGPARADVVYTLSDQTFSNIDPGAPFYPLSVTFTVSDAAVDRGTFVLVGQPHNGATDPNNPIIYAGNLSDFVSITVDNFDRATPSYLYGSLSLAFTFDSASKAVTSSDLRFVGSASEAYLGGVGADVSGTFSDDRSSCFSEGERFCRVSGTWTVPEPASFAMLLLGLAATLLAPVRGRASA